MQPPKLSKSAKQDLIVSHLRSTRTCHTLKDLEKMLPSVASINGMQVKEYIQMLTDENLIRVEKIGSGNWYWCFGSDEKKARETRLSQLQKEVEKAQASYDEMRSCLAKQLAKRKAEANGGGGEADGDGDGDGNNEDERDTLQYQKGELEKEVQQLQAQWNAIMSLSTGDGERKSVQEKKAELGTLRQTVQEWTDNIYILEEYLGKLAGGDREIIAAVQQECYGEEYVEGEGLREI
ncbi:hypothetical protein SI65_00695 [Aspergillus cristatus]|uniref:Meiotic nuclear division protein 1 n=1 Tax=Aspergillus cristatus TaxID=573508 RepID=A0A1E3BRW8_ASPCR|nr:hypothetical protein SI65_00695 [Aspergillus cristatus]